MTEEMMIQALTGPVAALALCLLALYAIFKWVGSHLPKWVDRHLNQIDRIVESHNEDRTIYKEGLTTLNTNMQELRGEVNHMKEDVRDIKAHVKARD